MAYKWIRSLDLTLKELLNLRLQHIAGDHSSTSSGTFYYDSTANRPAVRTNAAYKRVAFTDDVPGAGELDAADIAYDNGAGSDLDATDVQAAIEELEDEKASTGSVTTVATSISDHIADNDDAHDAAAISYAGGTGISSGNVEGALDELATEKADTGHTHSNVVQLAASAHAESANITAWPNGFSTMPAVAGDNYGPNAGEAGEVVTYHDNANTRGMQDFTRTSDGKTYRRTYISDAWTSWVGFTRDGATKPATEISFSDSGSDYTATDVDAALTEVMDAVLAHIADNSAAHAAAAISYAGSTGLGADDVEEALDELDTEKASIAYVDQEISDLVGGAGGAYDTLQEIQAILEDQETDLTALLTAINERGKMLSFDVGDNSATSFTFTHNLNTRDIIASLAQKASPWAVVGAEIDFPTVNTVRVQFDSPAPGTNEYRLTISGKQG